MEELDDLASLEVFVLNTTRLASSHPFLPISQSRSLSYFATMACQLQVSLNLFC